MAAVSGLFVTEAMSSRRRQHECPWPAHCCTRLRDFAPAPNVAAPVLAVAATKPDDFGFIYCRQEIRLGPFSAEPRHDAADLRKAEDFGCPDPGVRFHLDLPARMVDNLHVRLVSLSSKKGGRPCLFKLHSPRRASCTSLSDSFRGFGRKEAPTRFALTTIRAECLPRARPFTSADARIGSLHETSKDRSIAEGCPLR